jgi:hypothetical protein
MFYFLCFARSHYLNFIDIYLHGKMNDDILIIYLVRRIAAGNLRIWGA